MDFFFIFLVFLSFFLERLLLKNIATEFDYVCLQLDNYETRGQLDISKYYKLTFYTIIYYSFYLYLVYVFLTNFNVQEYQICYHSKCSLLWDVAVLVKTSNVTILFPGLFFEKTNVMGVEAK